MTSLFLAIWLGFGGIALALAFTATAENAGALIANGATILSVVTLIGAYAVTALGL